MSDVYKIQFYQWPDGEDQKLVTEVATMLPEFAARTLREMADQIETDLAKWHEGEIKKAHHQGREYGRAEMGEMMEADEKRIRQAERDGYQDGFRDGRARESREPDIQDDPLNKLKDAYLKLPPMGIPND